jgi:hypothetical protein
METGLTLPDEATFKTDIQAINRFQDVVHANLKQGQDYGVIPGTSKPTLLKPGAEKITKLLGLCDRYEVLDRQEDWVKPFFRYLIKCQLVPVNSEAVITEGFGECNSMEAKYRWRESKRKCPVCAAEAITKGKEEYGGGWICFRKIGGCGAKWDDGDPEIEGQAIGRVENEDIYSQVNTLVKMAKKRALVDAALSAGRLSNVFTQDVEDMEEFKTEVIVKQTESKAPETKLETGILDSSEGKVSAPGKIQNVTEFKGLLSKHKVETREAYEILSIKSFMELVDLDKAWADIKAAKKI